MKTMLSRFPIVRLAVSPPGTSQTTSARPMMIATLRTCVPVPGPTRPNDSYATTGSSSSATAAGSTGAAAEVEARARAGTGAALSAGSAANR